MVEKKKKPSRAANKKGGSNEREISIFKKRFDNWIESLCLPNNNHVTELDIRNYRQSRPCKPSDGLGEEKQQLAAFPASKESVEGAAAAPRCIQS